MARTKKSTTSDAESITTISKKPTATKTKKDAETKTKTKSKKPVAIKTSKAKPTEPNITETPKYSEVILDYNRFGNIGFSHVHETVDISFLTKKKLTGKITILFHFLRNTPVTSERDTGKIAFFMIDGKPVIGITQKAGDYENQVFTLTKYKGDGTRQSTRKYSYNKVKNLLLQAFEFEVKASVDTDDEQEELEDIEGEEMHDIENATELLPDSDFEYDADNELDDAE